MKSSNFVKETVFKEYRRFGAAEPDDREFWTETGVLVGNGRFGLETQVGAGTEGGVIEVIRAERKVRAGLSTERSD